MSEAALPAVGEVLATALQLMSAFETACSSLLSDQERARAEQLPGDTPRAG